jgi:PEP-CTERM motif
MRFVLLISLFAAIIHADPITVVETVSGGPTDLFYSYNVPTSSGSVTASIRGDASCFDFLCGDSPPTATLDFIMDLYTAGPIRDGVAFLQLGISQTGIGGQGRISGAIGSYSLGSCASELTCILSGYFPFELGVPFTIELSGLAKALTTNGGAGFQASASLQLFEDPPGGVGPGGAPVQILLVPEPGSAGLAVLGLSFLALLAVSRRRKITIVCH